MSTLAEFCLQMLRDHIRSCCFLLFVISSIFKATDFFIDFCVMISMNQQCAICGYVVKLSVFFTLRESIPSLVTKTGSKIYTCFVSSRA